MATLDEFNWCTQIQNSGGTMTTENNDREVVFGNGYKQVASSGFNTERREFTIVYAGKDWKAVKAFCTNHRIKPFLWMPPDEQLGLFIVKSGSVALTPIAPGINEIRATFSEQFTSMQ